MKKKKYVLLTEECLRKVQNEATECIVEKTKENQTKGQIRENILAEIKDIKQRIAKLEAELKITIKKINFNNQEMDLAKKFSKKINDNYSPDNKIFVDIESKSIKHKAPRKVGKYVLLSEENFRIIRSQTTECIAEKTKENQVNFETREALLTKLKSLKEKLLEEQEKLRSVNQEINLNDKEMKMAKKFSKSVYDGYSTGKEHFVDVEKQSVKAKRKR